VACGRDPIDVEHQKPGESNDFGRGELLAAASEAAANSKSPAAFAKLRLTVEALRPQFNKSITKEAERLLVFAALEPMEAVAAEEPQKQLEALATTVWPVALREEPEENESAMAYVHRICAGRLGRECKHVVPERWPEVLGAVVWHRLKSRAREAYASCGDCKRDHSYKDSLERFNEHQTQAGAKAKLLKDLAHPREWPKAGENASPWQAPNLLELLGDGSAEFDGDPVGTAWRTVIAEKRNKATVLGLHVPPTRDVRSLRNILRDAAKAGYKQVALMARDHAFPYARKSYLLAVSGGSKGRVRVREADSVQLLVQALDVAAGDAAGDTTPVMRF
jgi:hypothetical protein